MITLAPFSFYFDLLCIKYLKIISVQICCAIWKHFFILFCILGGEHALDVEMYYKIGQRGCKVLWVDNFSYNRNRKTDDKTYWICSRKVCCL